MNSVRDLNISFLITHTIECICEICTWLLGVTESFINVKLNKDDVFHHSGQALVILQK